MSNIEVKGVIVSNDEKWIYDFYGIESVCPADVKKGLAEAEDNEVTIEINSGGGDVFAGNEIYYLLQESDKDTIADITGFAGSAATLICCGADKVRAVPSAMYMIHNVSSGAQGDYREMEHQSEVLQTANKAIATAYQMKTGLEEKELLKMMNDETWLSASEAKEHGFIDEVIGEDPQEISHIYNGIMCNILPSQVINQMQTMRAEKEAKRLEELEGLIHAVPEL